MMENLELINKVVENDASVAVIEGLNALGDMFIRHNAFTMMKNLNNSRGLIQAIEQGFQLIAQMIDSRVSASQDPIMFLSSRWTDPQCSTHCVDQHDQVILRGSSE